MTIETSKKEISLKMTGIEEITLNKKSVFLNNVKHIGLETCLKTRYVNDHCCARWEMLA